MCALRRAAGFPLDDLTFVVAHFLPHLGCDIVYRILKAAGLSRRPAPATPERAAAKFKEYGLGFVHLDVKHLPKLRTADGECRQRFLFVAIDRRSRRVHLAVKDEETEASAKAFLEEALAAFPFRVTRVLTDRGSCFTAEGFAKACRELGVEHRETRPYTPRTNGMVERFNGRVQREVLGITVASHRDLERLLAGFNQAYNARRQRILDGSSPEQVVRERLGRDEGLANPGYRPPTAGGTAFTAASTAAGLGLLAFRRSPVAAIAAVVLLALPHLVGTPQPPEALTRMPPALAHDFAVAVLLMNFGSGRCSAAWPPSAMSAWSEGMLSVRWQSGRRSPAECHNSIRVRSD